MKTITKTILILSCYFLAPAVFANGYDGPTSNSFKQDSYYTKSVTLEGHIESRNGTSNYYTFKTNDTKESYILKN